MAGYQERLLKPVSEVCSTLTPVSSRLVSERGVGGKVHAHRSCPSSMQIWIQRLSHSSTAKENEKRVVQLRGERQWWLLMRMRGVVNTKQARKCMQEAAVLPAFGTGTR